MQAVISKRLEADTVRTDALEKVLGRTKYTTDMIERDVLYLRIVRSPHAHAFIKRIDTSLAETVGGVVKVATARDVPGSNIIGFFTKDQPLFCHDKVRFIGDSVAMVIAESPEAAELGLQAVKVDYEPLPASFKPEDSLGGVAVAIHEKGNLLDRYFLNKGNVEEGFREADVVIRGTYKTPIQEHAYMETEDALAFQTEPGSMTVLGSMQAPHAVERAVRTVLGESVPKVRIIQAPTGGAFGGKEDVPDEVCAMAALAAYLTKKPALLASSRSESMIFHPKRHPITFDREMGVTRDGRITAVRSSVLLDGGAYASLSPRVLFRAVCLVAGPYVVPNVYVEGRVAYTNNVPMGAFRGFAAPQACFAAELQMDEAAKEIGVDPLDFRLKNILRSGSTTSTGQVLGNDVGLEECLLKATEMVSWKSRRSSDSDHSGTKRRGLGIACMSHPIGFGPLGMDVASATVEVKADGSIVVRTGFTEIGQGLYTGYVEIVRRALGLRATDVRVELPDTSTTLDSGATAASRGIAMGGKALLTAAQQIRSRMATVASQVLSTPADGLIFEDDVIHPADSQGNGITFAELAKTCHDRRVSLKEDSWNRVTGVSWDKEKGRGSPFVSYAYMAHVAEVEVDTETGKVNVLNYVAAHDSGTTIVPVQFKSQVYGAVVQGLGYATMEELILQNGKMLNASFLDYHIPTAADIPHVTPIVVEAPDGNGPFGAKGIAEAAINPVAAAVANAVYDAVGFPIREFPYTPERVFSALTRRETKR